MKTLPVCIFTHNRTKVACATVNALLDHLKCRPAGVRYILCDDLSRPGHVDAVVKAFTDRGVKPSVHLNDARRHGLGASMNKGLEDAFSTSPVCLRLEDDWLLKRPLDLGAWAESLDALEIGSLRLGMMFRDPWELTQMQNAPDLWKLQSDFNRIFTFNNQVALVTKRLYSILGTYPENVQPFVVERSLADRYNKITRYGRRPPYVAWPKGWATKVYYHDTLAFDHIGNSTVGHSYYRIPKKYASLNSDG